jgi:hypothetical protein
VGGVGGDGEGRGMGGGGKGPWGRRAARGHPEKNTERVNDGANKLVATLPFFPAQQSLGFYTQLLYSRIGQANHQILQIDESDTEVSSVTQLSYGAIRPAFKPHGSRRSAQTLEPFGLNGLGGAWRNAKKCQDRPKPSNRLA